MIDLLNKINLFLEKIIIFILQKIFRRDIDEKKREAIVQFIKFGIVGVTNTVISYVLYAGSLLVFQRLKLIPNVDYLVAQVIAFVLSVLWSFYWNNKMVFCVNEGESRNVWKALIKTYISYSFTGLVLSSFLLIFWVQVVHISEYLAPILNLVISVPINFLINKFWAFKSR